MPTDTQHALDVSSARATLESIATELSRLPATMNPRVLVAAVRLGLTALDASTVIASADPERLNLLATATKHVTSAADDLHAFESAAARGVAARLVSIAVSLDHARERA